MSKPLIFCLPGQAELADALARGLDGERGELEIRRFPDGESYVRIQTECRDRAVVLAATLANPDDLALPLLFTARGLREQGAGQVLLVAPYLAYLRQDTRFHSGEVVTSAVFAEFLSRLFDGIVTIDPHLHRYRALDDVYTMPSRVIHAAPALARWIVAHVSAPLIVGPDSESEQWVQEVAEGAGAPFTVMSKVRRGDRDVTVEAPDLSRWQGRTPVLVDDIVSTARTMTAAVRQLRGAGYPPPVCVGVHAIFSGDAYQTLQAAGPAGIVTGNSVPHPSNGIDLIPDLLAPVIELLDREINAAG